MVTAVEPVSRFARLEPFKPSREQLIRYHRHLNRAFITKRDKKTKELKVTFDDEALKRLIKKHPDDPIYSMIIDYRELDKLSGGYVGKIEGING